jgi:uncharacterized delta-60 repeat protein
VKTLSSAAKLGLLLAAFAFSAYSQTCPYLPGCLDDSFGNGGVVTTSVNSNTSNGWANAVVVQSDDKIVVAADSHNAENPNTSDFYVLRYLPGGTLDSGFGTGGVARITITAAADYERPYAVAIQADGKILVGGIVVGKTWTAAVARLNTDGSLDSSFGTAGKITFTYINKENAQVTKIRVASNGAIVLGGTSGGNFGIARLTPSGKFDTSFNGSGKISVSVSAPKSAQDGGFSDLVIQPDGKYLASGLSSSGPRQPRSWSLVRLNPNGTLDLNFGSNGKLTHNLGGNWSNPRNLHVYSDGSILAVGERLTSPYSTYVFIRYLSNGQLDTSFGSSGMLMREAGGASRIEGMFVEGDGKIVGAGHWRDPNNTNTNLMIMRLHADGSMDESFGTGGFTFIDLNGLNDAGHDLAVQSDGKYVLAGIASLGSGIPSSIGLYRFTR